MKLQSRRRVSFAETVREIVVGVISVCALLCFVNGCIDSGGPGDAVHRLGKSIRDKDVAGFLAAGFMEGVTQEALEVNRGILEMMFEKKILGDREMVNFGMIMCDAEILEVKRKRGGAYVKFAPRDGNLRAGFESEGLAGLVVETIKTAEGWKVNIETIRPVFAAMK